MAESLPYMVNIGTLKKALKKIAEASTPDRFTQDYLGETLGMKGGTARTVIPFLKKAGFLDANGVPTEWYREFRNPTLSGQAAAKALRKAYAPLFASNENAHKLGDTDLRGLVLQSTGLDHDSRVVTAIVGTFKALKGVAAPEVKEPSSLVAIKAHAEPEGSQQQPRQPQSGDGRDGLQELPVGMNLSYTINLNLPATPDINVFNAIFRSLKENLLKR